MLFAAMRNVSSTNTRARTITTSAPSNRRRRNRVVENGVSMLAICAKETSDDTTYLADTIRQSQGNGALKTEADKYLANLKAKAQIVYS